MDGPLHALPLTKLFYAASLLTATFLIHGLAGVGVSLISVPLDGRTHSPSVSEDSNVSTVNCSWSVASCCCSRK